MQDEPIAIVGLGAMLPGASSVDAYWDMILSKRSQIREVPPSRWDANLFYDPDPKAPYRTNSKIGSFLEDDIGFRTKDFKMPPIMREHLDPTQQLALVTAQQALRDAGVTDREPRNWAVLIGNLLGGSWKRGEHWLRTQQLKTEAQLCASPAFNQLPSATQRELLEAIQLQLPWSQQPKMTPDSLPGLLGNLIASRISHFFNLTGPNYTIDAACATSLAALEQAVQGLRLRKFDAALTGGVDRIVDPSSFIGFSKMGVLSPTHSAPFDVSANGFVMGEGCALFVLKRLDDAIAQGDTIYAVLRGIGSSTDGLGKAIAAPNPKGQTQAIQRAYQDAGVDPATIDLIECHGTSTPIGDPSEIAGLRGVWDTLNRTQPVAIGSIKSNLGHLKGAAGAAALLKSVLCLQRETLAPQINFTTPNPHCAFEETPFRVQTEAEPWEAPKKHPRRCGVSAFGFGGINYHVVLEEAPSQFRRTSTSYSKSTLQSPQIDSNSKGHTFMKQDSQNTSALPLDLPILALGADTRAELVQTIQDWLVRLEQGQDLLAVARSAPYVGQQNVRAALYMDTPEKAKELLTLLAKTVEQNKSVQRLEAKGVAFREGAPIEGKIALMFPGQGSQYVHMMREFKEQFPIVRQTLDEADAIMKELLPKPLTEYMNPPSDVDDGTAFMELLQTEVLQPAVLAADTAMYRLLSDLLPTDLVMGHSLGEYGAAIAAGVFSFEDALRIVAARGEAIAAVADHMDDVGVMIGVGTDAEAVQAILDEVDEGYVIVANKNCPTQTIIAGATEPTMNAAKRLEEKGFDTIQLPVSHAFHSSIVSPASPFLLEELKKIDIHPPKCTILSNVTATAYPMDQEGVTWIRDTLSVHLARPVEWQKMVELAYEEGYRTFVEIGPKRALSSFVKDILKDKPHASYFSSHPKFGELESLGRMMSGLVADGVIEYGVEVQQDTQVEVHTPTTQVKLPSQPVRPYHREETKPMIPPAHTPQVSAPTQVNASYTPEPTIPQPPPTTPALPNFPPASLPSPSYANMAQLQGGWGSSPALPSQASPSLPTMPTMPAYAVFADPGFWQFMTVHGGLYFQHLVDSYRSFRSLTTMQLNGMMPSMTPVQPMAPVQSMAPMQGQAQWSVPVQAPRVTPAPTPASVAPSTPAPPVYVPPVQQATAPTHAATQLHVPAFVAPATTPDAVVKTEQAGDLTAQILQIVADRTGYEVEELGLDEHLEADLGIDSIRQVEVMAEVRELFQLPRDDNFDITAYSTLRSLVQYVESMQSGGQHGRQSQAGNDSEVSG